MAAKGTTYLCKHCDCLLLKKAYERHKLLYYDEEAKQWIKKRCLDPDSSSELFDEVDFDTTDNDQAAVEMECPPPLFELQFDEHFESDCVTEDEVDNDYYLSDTRSDNSGSDLDNSNMDKDYLCEEIWEDEDQAIDKDQSMDGNQEVEEDIFNSTATESTRGNIKENRLAEWLLLFLLRLQAELSDLWVGVSMSVQIGGNTSFKTVRGAVLCCACDLPAGRKVCGFLSYTASRGCSKCFKLFGGKVGSMNYSGFDRSLWTPRTNDRHRKDVKAILRGTSKSSKAEIESKIGCRYTVLLQLPYFNPPQMLAIDPMHNLFLGTAKHFLSIWLEHEYISRNDFKSIQSFVDGTEVPADVGRIPRKIETGFAGFTADQFKNWVTIYSVPSLYGHLPSEHLECWRRFVLACRIL